MQSKITIKNSSQDFNSNESVAIILISNENQIAKFDFSENLNQQITNAIKEEKTKVWSLYTDKKYVVYSSKSDKQSLRKFGAIIYKQLKEDGEKVAHFEFLEGLEEEKVYALVEGIVLSSYDFLKYKSKKAEHDLTLYLDKNHLSEENCQELNVISEATSLTKTLVNEPPNFLNAPQFSKEIQKAGEKFGFEVEVLNKKEIEELGMGGLLGVNKGSTIPPTFNIMHYKPSNAVNKQPIVLVGKGVTFDTGGYSLKTGGHMSTMKSDMGGGASVLGIISAVAGNKLPYHVIGIIPATDNKIDGDALLVDDIITTMDKTTVEVQNTDAEGRLILCDGLTYAKRFNPELVIDIATLTGASAAITGDFGVVVAGNIQEEIDKLKVLGEDVYERIIQLPLWEEHRELLKSEVADIKNIGGPIAGASTAGKFLEHFTDYNWIHMDIAGAAFLDSAKDYRQSGGTAVSVRLLYKYIKNKANNTN